MNYLRTKNIEIGDKVITVKEFSIASQTRMQADPDKTGEKVLKECIGEENYNWYIENKENIPRWFPSAISQAIDEVNQRPSFLPPLPKVTETDTFRGPTTGDKTVESVD